MKRTLLSAVSVAVLTASAAVVATGEQSSDTGAKGEGGGSMSEQSQTTGGDAARTESPHMGQVTEDAAPVEFDDLDVSQYGKITRTEARNYPDLNEKWDQINTDQDNTLEKAEFAEFQQQLNKSGKPKASTGSRARPVANRPTARQRGIQPVR